MVRTRKQVNGGNGNGQVTRGRIRPEERRHAPISLPPHPSRAMEEDIFELRPEGMWVVQWHQMVLFAKEYPKDLNPELAYIRAGGTAKNARITGNRWLNHPVLRPIIEQQLKERASRVEVTADRVLQEVAALAYFNEQDLYDANGDFIPIHQLPRHIAAAIGGIKAMVKKTQVADDGTRVETRTMEFKHWNKNQALELLMRHLGMLNDKLNVNVHERREVNVRVQIDQLKETYNRDELKQLLALHAKLPAGDGTSGSVDAGDRPGGNGTQRVH